MFFNALFLTLFIQIRYIVNYVSSNVMTAKKYLTRTLLSLVLYFFFGFCWCYAGINFDSSFFNISISILCGVISTIFLIGIDDTNKKPEEFIEPSQINGYNSISELTGKEGIIIQKIEDNIYLGKLKTNEDIVVRGELSENDEFVITGMENGYIMANKKEVN